MNNQLIEKIIEANGETCPKLAFENPLLDKNVAKALSKSFVKILKTSKENSNLNNNLRLYILENIRKCCTTEPEGHLPIDENITAKLKDMYVEHLNCKSQNNSTDKELEAFLIRKYKCLRIDSQYEPTTSPDISQALINLDDSGIGLKLLANDITHLNTNNTTNSNFINSLWNNQNEDSICEKLYDDIAIKMKPEMERTILKFCYEMLTKEDIDIESEFTNNDKLTHLVKRAAVSSICFQMCSSILNYLFVMTKFESKLQKIIQAFVKGVKQYCPENTFSVLYPIHINNVALMLDFDINELPEPLQSMYKRPALKLLKDVQEKYEYGFIMLLSHFPQWFDIFFSNETDKNMS